MLENWNNAIVTDISLAAYVAPNTGKTIHSDRPFYGFVINASTSETKFHFSDGTVLHTHPNELYYLPKSSSYVVEKIVSGGCWAINFDLLESVFEKPFSLKFRNHEAILKTFKDAVTAWEERKSMVKTIVRRCVYDIIEKTDREIRHTYIPSKKQLLIKPAVDFINQNFTNNALSVNQMAKLCGITDAYFRRIFMDTYSISPKEYIINLRIGYAKQLLKTQEFSVTEIALMCGYYEPSHFSREFKKRLGLSPNEYSKSLGSD